MTADEFRSAVFQIVSNNCSPSKGLKASALGNLVLRSLGESWQQHGYARLKDLLQDLEKRGQITLGIDEQGALAVWLGSESPTTAQPAPPSTSLRKEVWLAFVALSPKGRRFLNRLTGAVRMGLTDSPSPSEQWIEITPVSDTEQRRWAQQFFSEHLKPNQIDARELLSGQSWYVEIVRRLKAINEDLPVQWQRTRSAFVAREVHRWSLENSVGPGFLFDTPAPQQHQEDEGVTTRRTLFVSGVRDQILSALARMPTSELVELPIPAKYLLSVNDKQREK